MQYLMTSGDYNEINFAIEENNATYEYTRIVHL
jgi:hypothetical protein